MNSKQAKLLRKKMKREVDKRRDPLMQKTAVLVLENLCGQRFRRRLAIAWCVLRGKDTKILTRYLFQ